MEHEIKKIHTYIYTYTLTNLHTHIHTHTYTHIHTYIHAYIYAYIFTTVINENMVDARTCWALVTLVSVSLGLKIIHGKI